MVCAPVGDSGGRRGRLDIRGPAPACCSRRPSRCMGLLVQSPDLSVRRQELADRYKELASDGYARLALAYQSLTRSRRSSRTTSIRLALEDETDISLLDDTKLRRQYARRAPSSSSSSTTTSGVLGRGQARSPADAGRHRGNQAHEVHRPAALCGPGEGPSRQFKGRASAPAAAPGPRWRPNMPNGRECTSGTSPFSSAPAT